MALKELYYNPWCLSVFVANIFGSGKKGLL